MIVVALFSEAAPKARSAAQRALAIDDLLAEGHVALAAAYWARLDFDAAEREFRRALELNPNYANAHHVLAGPAFGGYISFPPCH